MHEIELKFQIPAHRLDEVRAELGRLGANLASPLILQAAYFDTPDRRLAQARSALRVRREGDDWVQTLKAAGSHTMLRVEDNRPRPAPGPAQAILPDLSLHAGEAARSALVRALGWQPEGDTRGERTGLVELYRTDMRRTRALCTVSAGTPHEGVVELALDEGAILAGPLSQEVRELEIELVSGHPQAVIDAGRDWVQRFGLWLDTQTKAHRGDRLARRASHSDGPSGPDKSAANEARPVRLPEDATLDQAWRAGLESCLAHITANMSELAGLAPDADQTQVDAIAYQWRRGLRRLSAFAALLQKAPLNADAAEATQAGRKLARRLSRMLGRWRDAAGLAWIPSKIKQKGGPSLAVPPAPTQPPTPTSDAPAVAQPDTVMALAQCADATELCLLLLTALVSAPGPTARDALAQPAAPWLSKHIRARHRACKRAVPRGRGASVEEAHRLRKRLRELRDVRALFEPSQASTSGEGQALDRALRALGLLQDQVVALARYQSISEREPQALFACGWLMGRQARARRRAWKAVQRWSRA